MGKGLLIDPRARQCVVDVRERDDLGLDRDLLPPQPVGIAAPVIPLVVPAADVVGHLEQLLLVAQEGVLHDLRAEGAVGLHDLVFRGRQGAGFIQNFLRDGDLPHIVQRGGVDDQRRPGGREGVAVGDLLELAQENLGEGADVQHVQPAFPVAELDDVG